MITTSTSTTSTTTPTHTTGGGGYHRWGGEGGGAPPNTGPYIFIDCIPSDFCSFFCLLFKCHECTGLLFWIFLSDSFSLPNKGIYTLYIIIPHDNQLLLHLKGHGAQPQVPQVQSFVISWAFHRSSNQLYNYVYILWMFSMTTMYGYFMFPCFFLVATTATMTSHIINHYILPTTTTTTTTTTTLPCLLASLLPCLRPCFLLCLLACFLDFVLHSLLAGVKE